MTNTALTGATFDIDGGQQLVLGLTGRTSASPRGRSAPCAPTSSPAARSPTTSCPITPTSPGRLSELQGDDPLILTLARGHYCPKEHQQHLELAAFYPKIAVAYTRIATIATDEHHTLQEFRASVGAQWTVPLRPRAHRPAGPGHPGVHRPRARPDDPAHARAQARAGDPQHLQRLLVLGPPVDRRPLARPAGRHARDPPRLGPQHARAARGLGRGRPLALPRLGPAGRGQPATGSCGTPGRRGADRRHASGGSTSS